MAVPQRRIGPAGLELPALSLGSWHIYDRMRFEKAVALVRRAVDSGVTLFDVGVYGGSDGPGSFTDVLFGRIVEAAGVRRSGYLLSEKLWLEEYPRRPLAEQLDQALLRVGADYADLAVVGDVVDPEMDLGHLVRDLADLVSSGRLRHWGVCNWRAAELRAAYEIAVAEGLPAPQLAQLKYSVCRRSIPDGEPYRRVFEETGIGLQASDVLEGGILAGKVSPARAIGRDPGDIRPAIIDAAPRLAEIAGGLGATAAQLAVAFCLTHPATATVLVGTSSVGQLDENLGALAVLERHGAAAIRSAVDELWLDREAVAPTGGGLTD